MDPSGIDPSARAEMPGQERMTHPQGVGEAQKQAGGGGNRGVETGEHDPKKKEVGRSKRTRKHLEIIVEIGDLFTKSEKSGKVKG